MDVDEMQVLFFQLKVSVPSIDVGMLPRPPMRREVATEWLDPDPDPDNSVILRTVPTLCIRYDNRESIRSWRKWYTCNDSDARIAYLAIREPMSSSSRDAPLRLAPSRE